MKRMLTMALLVAATMSATVSASAQGRRGEFRGRRGDFRKEIRFKQCDCPRCAEWRRMQTMRTFRLDPRFMDPRMDRCRLERNFRKEAKFDKRHLRR